MLKAKKLNEGSVSRWDAFCLANRGAWYWHTTGFLKLKSLLRPQAESCPERFWVDREEEMVAICPLATEKEITPLGERFDFLVGGERLANTRYGFMRRNL